MEIEHLGYRVKSDDNTFELILKLKQATSDDEARKKIEDFFDTFSIKVNVVTLVKVATEGKPKKHERKYKYDIPTLEKRQFVILHYLPVRFSLRDYVNYYIGQSGDEKPYKANFYATIRPLLEEGRIKDTGLKKGKAIIYERIKTEEDEGQPGDVNDVLILNR